MIEISGYKIIKEIGHGGMSTVYLAIQKSVYRYVALKAMSSHLVHDETFTKRFLSEARIAARFRHPNIISILDVNVVDGVPYIAMEYVPGGELSTERIKSMSLTEKLSVLVQIADALGFLHKQNFVHRDIKPANILFREDNSVVLTDFGVARDQTATSGMTLTGYIIGTPHYLSPEQAQGGAVDARSDLYSLGVLMFRVLTTRLPYIADDAISICTMHVHADIPDLPKEFKKFDQIIKKAMAKLPEDRFQSANEFIDNLISVTGSKTAQLLQRSVEGVALEAIHSEDVETSTRKQVQITEADLGTKIQPTLGNIDLIRSVDNRNLKNKRKQKTSRTRSEFWQGRDKRIVFGGLVGVLLVIVIVIFVSMPDKKISLEEPPATPPISLEPAHTDERIDQAVEPEASPKEAPSGIDVLLIHGYEALEQGIYVQPFQFSALGYFREVLELEPGNVQAQMGLESLANALLDLMEASLSRGEMGVAEQLLSEARLTESADPTRLVRLQDVLQGRGGASNGQDEEIAQLLARGYDYLASNQLTQPADANAVSEFNQALLLDEDNADAIRGLEQVGIRYLVLARDQISSGNWNRAESFWQNSNNYAPGAVGADDVRKILDENKLARASRQQQNQPPPASVPNMEVVPYRLPPLELTGNESLGALYRQAEQAKKSGDRMKAYALYKEVWRRDPDFGRAKKRLNSGAGSYINVASRDILKGDLLSARKNLSIALALDASHFRFDSVRRDYLTAVDRSGVASMAQSQSTSIADIQIKSIMEEAEFNHSKFELDSANRLAARKAQERYREVLAMRGDYQAARNGLNRLFQDFLGAARQALSQSRNDDAAWFLGNAREISPSHPDLLALEGQLN